MKNLSYFYQIIFNYFLHYFLQKTVYNEKIENKLIILPFQFILHVDIKRL